MKSFRKVTSLGILLLLGGCLFGCAAGEREHIRQEELRRQAEAREEAQRQARERDAALAHVLALEELLGEGRCAGKAYFITNHEPLPQVDLIASVPTRGRETGGNAIDPPRGGVNGATHENRVVERR